MARKSFADLTIEEFNELREKYHLTKHDYTTVKVVWDNMQPLLSKSLSLIERASACYDFFSEHGDLYALIYNMPSGLNSIYSLSGDSNWLPECTPDWDKHSAHDIFPITKWKKWITDTKKAIKFAEKAIADAEWIMFMSVN